MSSTVVDRLVAGGVFLFALVLYLLTVAPTASFWDAGEFIAIASGLQVSHPPGAPFYMLIGRFFSLFAFSPEHVALAVNLVSVVASALTILLTHLVLVELVRIWQADEVEAWPGQHRLVALVGGVVGACAFAASDSFWFNAVEAEVYAMSMFFTAVVVWLTLRWRRESLAEMADIRARGVSAFGLRADRYLVLIAYLFGLAIGVHLLNVLTLFFIAVIVYFSRFEKPGQTTGDRLLGLAITMGVAGLAFLVIYPGVIQTLPSMAEASGVPTFFAVLVIVVAAAAVAFTHRAQKPVLNMIALSVAMVLIGYSTYGLIFVRSAADPPIDENDPETPEAIVSYLKREQYGTTPLLTGASYDNATGTVDQKQEKFFPAAGRPNRITFRSTASMIRIWSISGNTKSGTCMSATSYGSSWGGKATSKEPATSSGFPARRPRTSCTKARANGRAATATSRSLCSWA